MNIKEKKETWTRTWRSNDRVSVVYLWGIEDPPRYKRKGGKGGIVGEEKSVWSKSQFWNSINININYTSPSIFKQPCNSCLLPINVNRQTSQLFFKFFHRPHNSQSLWIGCFSRSLPSDDIALISLRIPNSLAYESWGSTLHLFMNALEWSHEDNWRMTLVSTTSYQWMHSFQEVFCKSFVTLPIVYFRPSQTFEQWAWTKVG